MHFFMHMHDNYCQQLCLQVSVISITYLVLVNRFKKWMRKMIQCPVIITIHIHLFILFFFQKKNPLFSFYHSNSSSYSISSSHSLRLTSQPTPSYPLREGREHCFEEGSSPSPTISRLRKISLQRGWIPKSQYRQQG